MRRAPLQLGANPTRTSALTLNGGTIRALANTTFANDATLATGGMTVDGNDFALSLSGVISGSGGLTKNGLGSLRLTAANTYNGDTTVAQGTLLVNGSITSDTIVQSGATLGGSGRINGAVTVENGGILAPGASAGTLTIGALTLSSLSQINLELGPVTGPNDGVVVNGAFTLDGMLNITDLGGATPGPYTLFSFGGPLTDHGLTLGRVPDGFTAEMFVVPPVLFINSQVGLLVTSVPEHGSVALLLLGGLSLCGRRFYHRHLSRALPTRPS